ncbi:MAG: hypothetical protein JXR73_10175 [Candidatus Omnitrophica bacterium]|nr:hypothetical protein [Candidatus Omnitrophota bacterium]
MVTTAADVRYKTTTGRSINSQFYLWSIPLITWGLLTAVFILSPDQNMVKLISTDNPTLFNLVQGYLESENILFELEGDAILIQAGQKNQIWLDLSQQEWFDPGAQWDRGAQTPISRSDNSPLPDAALAQQILAGGGST